MPEKKSWWNSWIGALVGLGTICTMILGALTWQYDTFATDEEVDIIEEHAQHSVAQLSQKTLEGFDAVNKTNMQMQKSIRRFDLKDSHEKFIDQKYRILKLLESDPNNHDLKKDLDECKSKIKMMETELRELRIGK